MLPFKLYNAAFLLAGFLTLPLARAEAQTAAPLTRFVIEDAESIAPTTYFDEKPALIETSAAKFTEGKQSLHFVTGNTHASGYIVKYYWPTARDFSAIAKSGTITFDLWVKNPADLHEGEQHTFDFTLGSRSNEQFSGWVIPTGLLQAQQWNRITLRLADGRTVLPGSKVNDESLTSIPGGTVINGDIDWTKVNYSRLGLLVEAPVEGYLDNVVAQTAEPIVIPHRDMAMQLKDPTPHLAQAKAENVANNYKPRYEIVPPDIRPDAFFPDDALQWDKKPNWQATFYNCRKEVFALSNDQALRKVPNAKIEFTAEADARVVLNPTTPIVFDKSFNIVDFWVYGYYHGGSTIKLDFKRPDGTTFTWSSDANSYVSPGYLFENWTLAHVALPELLPTGTQLASIEFIPSKPGDYLFHIDQLRVLNFQDYLKNTPPPVYRNIGAEITLPTNPNGACPTSDDKVETAVELVDGVGRLRYTANGQTVTYLYRPQSGTLSDLTVEANGRPAFQPAAGSGPVFEYEKKPYGVADSKAECIEQRRDGQSLVYTWRYTTAGGISTITYRFSLRGKTLAVDVESPQTHVKTWLFGEAHGTRKPKVVQIPFMLNGPRLLCDDGLFTTYYTDWYFSNTSTTSYLGAGVVTPAGDGTFNVAYSYTDPGYHYLPRTNGERYPLKERLYITTSSQFGDCLLNIANPPSPLKNQIAGRLYRMISPKANWVELTRRNAAVWDYYGMNKIDILYHAGFFSNRGGRGPEPWHSRLRTSVATKGGDQAVAKLFAELKAKGMKPGIYGGYNFWEPISRTWDYNSPALMPDGSWQATWVQAYHMKPRYFAELAKTASVEQKKKFGHEVIYEDGWTSGTPFEQNDYDHRMPGSGRLIDTLHGMAMGWRNLRETVGGPVFSEGNGTNFMTAGMNEGDYGKLAEFATAQTPDKKRTALLVDFALRKVHPLHGTVSLDIGYYIYAGAPKFDAADPQYFHHFLAAQIAFGTIGMLEPYSELYEDPTKHLDLTLTSYFMMQQLQQRYIMEPVDSIRYFDGTREKSTSEAVTDESYRDNMLHIRYRNGLEIYLNANWDKKNWTIEDQDQRYILPPGGWYARQANDFIEYAVLLDGNRVDFVDSPEYTYLNGYGKKVALGGLTTDKIAIRHKTGKSAGKTVTFPK